MRRTIATRVVAAVVLVAALALFFVVRARRPDPVQGLVDAAPRSARSVEPRLSGGFPWAPYRVARGADDGAVDDEQAKLIDAADELLERAEGDSSLRMRRATGVALVLLGRAEESIPRLRMVAGRTSDARGWSDLAAAQYSAALAGRTALYPAALDSVNRALRIDGSFPEALFNRALILERAGLLAEAQAAWQRYLAVDSSSPWANEARQHVAQRRVPSVPQVLYILSVASSAARFRLSPWSIPEPLTHPKGQPLSQRSS